MSESNQKDELAPTIDMDTVKELSEHEAAHREFEAALPQTDISESRNPWSLKMTGVLMFLVALGLIYVWSQQAELRKQLEQAQSSALESDVRKLEQRMMLQNQEYQASLDQYREQQQLLASNLESAQGQIQRQADNNIELLQVESILRLANNRYVLLRDVESSMLAMQQAIELLKGKSRPELIAIREQVHKELASLQSIKTVDVSSYLLTLSEMTKAVSELKLISVSQVDIAATEPKLDDAESSWAIKWKQLLAALKPVLIIRRSEQSPQFVMTSEEERLIRLVLVSRYDYVRQALLREDGGMLSVAASSAHDWLVRYFDHQQTQMQPAVKVLTELQSIRFTIDYPPIGQALKLLTQYISQPETQAPLPELDKVDGSTGELP